MAGWAWLVWNDGDGPVFHVFFRGRTVMFWRIEDILLNMNMYGNMLL